MYDDNSFCCLSVNGHSMLNQNHEYYFQVQGQMATTGIHTCDFVIWTPSDFLVLSVLYDENFWTTQCYPSILSNTFIMLPEIVYPKYPELPFDYSHVLIYP